MLKNIIWILLFAAPHTYGEFSGEVNLENRYFLNTGAYGNTKQADLSLMLTPEYSYSWEQDRKVITIIPYARLSQLDEGKNSFDIREMSFVSAWEKFELRAGISTVFWGVTESVHLVDVINQTDLIANIDGEEKLGQPMINLTYVSEVGNFDYFLLPYFRERTFSGKDGRFRTSLPVDTDNPNYLNEDKEKHIDQAFRWSHYWESLDWGLSYFRGTNRIPSFSFNKATGKLSPVYGQTEQIGLELQYVYKDLLLKGEFLRRDDQLRKAYFASITGFEYTFSNKFGGVDIGILYEWIYDGRNENSDFGIHDASFIGTRIALNDEKSSELLVGGILHNQNLDLASLRVEGSRRINENWKWTIEANLINSPRAKTLFDQVKDDDYIQVSLSFFF